MFFGRCSWEAQIASALPLLLYGAQLQQFFSNSQSAKIETFLISNLFGKKVTFSHFKGYDDNGVVSAEFVINEAIASSHFFLQMFR